MYGEPDDAKRDSLGDLERQTEETVRFFSNRMKPERERTACAAFLRCLGVAFQDHEIVSSLSEPPDVVFRSAAFEVREILDPGRERGKEYHEDLERIRCARSLEDLAEPYRPESVPWGKVLVLVQVGLAEKSAHYAAAVRAKLDALFYVNLTGKSLDGRSLLPDAQSLAGQGWRSVSVLFPLYACVLWAGDEAPDFLRYPASRVRSEWRDLDSLWELPPGPPQ